MKAAQSYEAFTGDYPDDSIDDKALFRMVSDFFAAFGGKGGHLSDLQKSYFGDLAHS